MSHHSDSRVDKLIDSTDPASDFVTFEVISLQCDGEWQGVFASHLELIVVGPHDKVRAFLRATHAALLEDPHALVDIADPTYLELELMSRAERVDLGATAKEHFAHAISDAFITEDGRLCVHAHLPFFTSQRPCASEYFVVIDRPKLSRVANDAGVLLLLNRDGFRVPQQQ
jgi:hypothetical protein